MAMALDLASSSAISRDIAFTSFCLPTKTMQTLENEIHAAAASIESFDSTFVHLQIQMGLELE
jgi:hypothetical protein